MHTTPLPRPARRTRATWSRWLAGTGAAFVWLPALASDYVFTRVGIPGLLAPTVYGINDSGAIVGAAADASGNGFGYLYDGGNVTRLYGPTGASDVSPSGVSNNGVVVGSYVDGATGAYRAFVYADGAYTSIANGLSGPRISPNGRYVSGGDWELNQYFVLDRTTNTTTWLPISGSFPLHVGNANDAGQVVGNFGISAVRQSFVHDLPTGTTRYFTFPEVRLTSVNAINNLGQMTGYLSEPGKTGFSSWVGDGSTYRIVNEPGFADTSAYGINNLGQIVGFADNFGVEGQSEDLHGFIATPATAPSSQSGDGVYSFHTAVLADVPIFIDPAAAVGYDYQAGLGDPRFKTVSLPLGIGDNRFTIEVGGQSFEVAGNQIFDFTVHGFAAGVTGFRVLGIEAEAGLDPNDPTVFVTRLTFAADGMFTGTQSAITAVPEPSVWALFAAGLLALAGRRAVQHGHASARRGRFVSTG